MTLQSCRRVHRHGEEISILNHVSKIGCRGQGPRVRGSACRPRLPSSHAPSTLLCEQSRWPRWWEVRILHRYRCPISCPSSTMSTSGHKGSREIGLRGGIFGGWRFPQNEWSYCRVADVERVLLKLVARDSVNRAEVSYRRETCDRSNAFIYATR